jgi:hypothetical protein
MQICSTGGFHRIDERDARDTNGALGINGVNTHAAVKYTLPVTDRLTAYGKLGVAYSEMGGRRKTGRVKPGCTQVSGRGTKSTTT